MNKLLEILVVCTTLMNLGFQPAISSEPTKIGSEPIKIGVAAMISPKDTFKYYKAMVDYVGVMASETVELVQRPTYSGMDELLKSEKVNIAFLCSGPYVKDKAEFGVELLVAPVSYGQPFYHSYIIAGKDSPITSLADMEGKDFSFTDPHSNTGCLVPTYMVGTRFKKTPEKFFSRIQYSKQHDKSIELVAKGLTDGAAVDSLIYDYDAANNPIYTSMTKIVEKSPAYGIPPIVVTKGIDPVIKAKFKKAFLEMADDPKGKEILDKLKIDKFIVPDDKNYDTIRTMEAWQKEFQKK